MEENLGALNVKLSKAEVDQLAALVPTSEVSKPPAYSLDTNLYKLPQKH